MSEKPQNHRPAESQKPVNTPEATPVDENSVAPIIHPGDHRNPDDPRLPLVSPIVDGGNL